METLTTVHLILALILVASLLTALIPLVSKGWSDRVGRWMRILAGVATAQWILGFFVWFSSISEGFNVFTGLVHPLAMTGVVAVAHMGAGQAARTEDVAARTSGARRSLLIIAGLVLVLAPWRQVLGG
ncbi:MAG: hypothetical protein ACKOI0_00050 [Actinomycetota bacterium]